MFYYFYYIFIHFSLEGRPAISRAAPGAGGIPTSGRGGGPLNIETQKTKNNNK